MKFYLSNINTWCANEQANSDSAISWPKLEFVPAMQRRRLSPFAKIALYVAHKTVESDLTNQSDIALPIVFSSRHGDIHKTSILLDNLAHQEMLSPTAFGLSVHNAVPSLYSILNNNKSEINAIAGGKDSFYMAIIDAYARLTTGVCNEVLFIHADQHLPESYDEFKDEQQISHAVAVRISLTETANSQAISCSFNHSEQEIRKNDTSALPAALAFSDWFDAKETELDYHSDNYHWHCKKI